MGEVPKPPRRFLPYAARAWHHPPRRAHAVGRQNLRRQVSHRAWNGRNPPTTGLGECACSGFGTRM